MMLEQQKEYEISDVVSERINILKLWFSIMVVYIHSAGNSINFTSGTIIFDVPVWLETLKFLVSSAISRCAVPGFFFLSAIFLYRKNFTWQDNCKKKFFTLLVPYLILNTLWIMLFAIGQATPYTKSFFANPNNIVMNWDFIRWMQAFGIGTQFPMLYPLWFVRDLIVINFLAVFYKKVVDFSPKLFAVLLCILWLLPIPGFGGNKQTVCFWGFGYLFTYYGIGLDKLDCCKKYILWIYPIFVVADCLMRGIAGNNAIHAICCVLGIVFWFTCFTNFADSKIRNMILYVSSYSFFIYLFHENTLTFFKKLCFRFLPSSSVVQGIAYIVIPFIIIGGCFVFGYLLRKYASRTYSILTGGRSR